MAAKCASALLHLPFPVRAHIHDDDGRYYISVLKLIHTGEQRRSEFKVRITREMLNTLIHRVIQKLSKFMGEKNRNDL